MASAKDRIHQQISKLEEKIQKDKLKIKQLQTKTKEQARKARTRELIQIGGLAEIADLLTVDKGAVLGLFIKGREMLQDKETYLRFKQVGDRTLQERASKRRSHQNKK